jgi:hypothetical protein
MRPASRDAAAAAVRPVMPVMHHVVHNWDLFAGAATGLLFGRKKLASEFAPCRSHRLTRMSPMKRRARRF